MSAAAIASLDLIAPGRTVLGIGAGHSGTHNLGLARSRAGDLAAATRYIKALLAGKPARYRDGGTAQLERAQAAGLKRVMLTVSVASDPAGTVERFGAEVLPDFR